MPLLKKFGYVTVQKVSKQKVRVCKKEKKLFNLHGLHHQSFHLKDFEVSKNKPPILFLLNEY
jgi:hypothetical protein